MSTTKTKNNKRSKSKGFSKKPKYENGFNSPSGSGGLLGKPKTKAPVDAAETGYSNSYLQVLAGISEGPIGGLVQGGFSIRLGDTPAQNEDGSHNFQGFSYEFRNGTQNQSYIPGYAETVDSENSVSAEVIYLQPITRQIINRNCDAIIVRLAITLQDQPPSGGIQGTSVAFRISLKSGSGAFIPQVETTISGKYSSPTEFEYKIPTNNVNGTVDRFAIRVERLTETVPIGVNTVKTINFQSYIESSETKLSYPNTAIVGMKFEASQFTEAPSITFDVFGRLVDIPSNATINPYDGSISYVGIWDGTFQTPSYSTSDPAWILWDLLTNTRYGLGRQIKKENLNKWSFLTLSKYCNEWVPDGNGGAEKRFLVNFVLEGTEDAYKVIETLRSVFHGMSYYLGGALYFSSDSPGDYVAQFTQADIEDGMFSYSRSSLKAVHNVAVVTWIDPSDNYNKAIETVEDHESIITYGYRPTEILAFGCTSRGQARRAGLYTILSEKLDRYTVTFKCRAMAARVRPGDLIKIADSKVADIRYGGLIAAIDNVNLKVTLDYPVKLDLGVTYYITCLCEDGTIVERGVSNPAGTHTVIDYSVPFPSIPLVEGNWIIASVNVQPQLYRVLNRVAVAGSEETMYEITALQHNPDKYGAIDFDYPLESRSIRVSSPDIVTPVSGVTLGFQAIGVSPDVSFVLTASWQPPTLNGLRDQFVASYFVEYKIGIDGSWQSTVNTKNLFQEYPGLATGIYYIRVASVDLSGNASAWVESSGVKLGVINTIARFNNPNHSMFIDEI